MNRVILKSVLLALVCSAWVAGSAVAHHSYAMFDQAKIAKVSGTIAKVEWSNPHAFIWVYVRKTNGNGYDAWGFEGGSAGMVRPDWNKYTLKVGEKVSIEYNPLKNGGIGGSFRSATLADGTVVGGPPPAPRKGGAN